MHTTGTSDMSANEQRLAEVARQGLVEFVLDDAKGNPHKYTVQLHPTNEGQEILWTIIALGGEPLASLLQGVAGPVIEGLIDGGLATALDNPDLLKEALASIDWSATGHAIARSLRTTNMPKLTRALFRFTYRDGAHLRDPGAFNVAYQANYGEMLTALGKVIGANRFLPL